MVRAHRGVEISRTGVAFSIGLFGSSRPSPLLPQTKVRTGRFDEGVIVPEPLALSPALSFLGKYFTPLFVKDARKRSHITVWAVEGVESIIRTKHIVDTVTSGSTQKVPGGWSSGSVSTMTALKTSSGERKNSTNIVSYSIHNKAVRN